MPWNDEELNPESICIHEELVKVNRLGILTINSQPAVNCLPSTDPVHGWGSVNGYIFKEGWYSAKTLFTICTP